MSVVALFLTAYLVAILAAHLGLRLGLVDMPDARKMHEGKIPLTGGIAIYIAILLGEAIFAVPPYSTEMMIIAGGVFLVGVFDDFRHISPSLRLAIQYGAGILLVTYGGIAIHNVGDLLAIGDITLLFMTVPLTALAVAGLANAYNMIDGIDGLAAATIALPLLCLYALAQNAGHPDARFLLLILAPLAVFLILNLGPNTRLLPKVFLGDGGSVTLGFLVTVSLVYFSQGESAVIAPVTALWFVTVPLMDMLATMLRRYLVGRPIMEADRSHLHHTLIEMGLSSRQTLALTVAYAMAAAVTGLLLEAIPAYASLAIYFLLFCLHCLFVLERSGELSQPG